MRPRDPNPGEPPPDDSSNPERHPQSPKRARRLHKPGPPLWRPGDEPRDVNLEMTPEDLDGPAPPRPARPGSETQRRQRRPPVPPAEQRGFPGAPGLGRSLR